MLFNATKNFYQFSMIRKNSTDSRLPTDDGPPLPEMKFITYIDVNGFKSFKLEKHEEFEFIECLDRYVQIFLKSVGVRDNAVSVPRRQYAFGIYFGVNHPLNVAKQHIAERVFAETCELEAAILAIEIAAKNGLDKICINTSAIQIISKIRRLDALKQNGYIETHNGRSYSDCNYLKKLDQVLRENNELDIQWKFAPETCNIIGLRGAKDLARTVFQSNSSLKRTIDI